MAVRMVRVYDPSGMFPDEERLACAKCGIRPTAWGDALCHECQEQEQEDQDQMREVFER